MEVKILKEVMIAAEVMILNLWKKKKNTQDSNGLTTCLFISLFVCPNFLL